MAKTIQNTGMPKQIKKIGRDPQKQAFTSKLTRPLLSTRKQTTERSKNKNQKLRCRGSELEPKTASFPSRENQTGYPNLEASKLLTEQLIASEIQHGDLVSLYVALAQLHATLRTPQLLQTIRDIVCNLIGSEELAVFEIKAKATILSLVAAFGVNPGQLQNIPLGEGPIGRVASTGKPFFRNRVIACESNEQPYLTACVPLKLDGTMWGVLAIFRLLAQKDGLAPLDYRLLELLSTQAPVVLECAKLRDEKLASGGEKQ